MILDAHLSVDNTIGRLDRVLSEFLLLTQSETLDEADYETLKHHAHDLIGAGESGLQKLKNRKNEGD